MKKTRLFERFIFAFLVLFCSFKPFAQEPEQPVKKPGHGIRAISIIKLDELKTQEDIFLVKDALREFGFKVHSFKINFERKEVLVRMRDTVSIEELIAAFKDCGYTAWHDTQVKIQAADAAYKK